MNLAIIGMAGNFKSAVAALVASQKKFMRLDCDEYIEYNFSMPIEQFVKKTNVTYFKKQVSKTVDELFDFENAVFVSSDISLLSNDDLKKLSQNCFVVCLSATDATVLSKYSKIKPMSPLLNEEKVKKLNQACRTRYPKFSNFVLNVSKGSAKQYADKIVEAFDNRDRF